MIVTKILRRLAALAFAGAIGLTLYGALAPSREAPKLFPWDKAEHFTTFYVLSGLAALALPSVNLFWIAGALSALGAAIELLQALPMVNRDCDIFDWAADSLGVACALIPSALLLVRARLR